MGNARRAPYGSSKAAKTKNLPPKRRKSPPPPPPPQKFHPKNLGPLPNVTPADDLTDIVALANVLVALTAYIAFARRIGVLSVASLPLIGAGAGVLAGVTAIFFMNYDVDKQGKTVYDGHTDKDNSCVRWATRGLWSAIGLPAAVVRSISAKVLVIDIFSLKLATHDADGKRLNPEYEYVRVCKGYENAKQLALLYRDLIVAILIYVKVKKGRAVPVVSFGLSAASFVTAHLTGLDFVDVIGALMHPEAFLALPTSPATLAKKIANGKIVTVATSLATYVKADAAVAAVVALLAPGASFFASFHVGAFNGHATFLVEISKARSRKMLDRWASMTTAAREALSKKLNAANVKRWASMTTAAREALSKKLSAANVKRWASMTTAARKALCKKLKLAYDEGKMTGLVKKGETHSEATKAKMRKPKSDASNYVGNNNNTRDDTIHCYCPNPACDGGANGTAYRTSIPHQSRDFPKHFAKCSPCADFVRKALDEDDPEGVLFGSRFKWPKWLPAQQ